jgi:hypothetical protein
MEDVALPKTCSSGLALKYTVTLNDLLGLLKITNCPQLQLIKKLKACS